MKKFNRPIFLIFGVTLCTFSLVWTRLRIVSISYDINSLSQVEKKLREECSSITLKINEARSPHRLESLAQSKFHLAPPKPGQLIVLKEKK